MVRTHAMARSPGPFTYGYEVGGGIEEDQVRCLGMYRE